MMNYVTLKSCRSDQGSSRNRRKIKKKLLIIFEIFKRFSKIKSMILRIAYFTKHYNFCDEEFDSGSE